MKPFTPGQRVAAVIDGDIASTFGHGRQGTVHSHDPEHHAVVIDWDTGTRATLPETARLIRLTSSWVPTAGTELTWEQTLHAARAAGRNAATWWCRTTIGERATGNVQAAAWTALRAISDDDPTSIDALPLYESHPALGLGFPETVTDADVVTLMYGRNPNPWPQITTDQREAVNDAYRCGYDDALLEHVARQCRLAATATGDGRDLSHLHPHILRPGRYGIFSAEWYRTDDTGPDRYRVGFVGVLIGYWNGWAVFACDRRAAEHIVADRTAKREAARPRLRRLGLSPSEQDQQLDKDWGRAFFDADELVIDQRVMQADSEAIQRVRARADGRWPVAAMNLSWDAVDPADCDRIIGDLPDAGDEQAW